MRTLLTGFLTGFVAAQVFVVLMLGFDVGMLGSRIGAASNPLLPLGLLAGALGALVGTAACATAFALPHSEGSAPAPRVSRGLPAHRPVRALAIATIGRYWD